MKNPPLQNSQRESWESRDAMAKYQTSRSLDGLLSPKLDSIEGLPVIDTLILVDEYDASAPADLDSVDMIGPLLHELMALLVILMAEAGVSPIEVPNDATPPRNDSEGLSYQAN